MKLDIPFVKSRGWECGQACAAMMIKYYYPELIPDFDEINRVIHHKNGMYSFPPQLAILLDHYGVETKVFSSDDIKASIEDPDQFRRWFGKDYEHEMKYVDLPTVDWMASEIRKKELFVKKSTKFAELIDLFRQNNLVGFPIDWGTLTAKSGPYQGHFVIIAGEEGSNLLIHDPDIGPYQLYPLEHIKKAWEHPAIANDYLVSYGRK